MLRSGGRDTKQAEFLVEVKPEERQVRLARQQLMDRILELNQTATAEFLTSFDERDLSHYLDHLTTCSEQRGTGSRWVRDGGSPAIVTRSSRD